MGHPTFCSCPGHLGSGNCAEAPHAPWGSTFPGCGTSRPLGDLESQFPPRAGSSSPANWDARQPCWARPRAMRSQGCDKPSSPPSGLSVVALSPPGPPAARPRSEPAGTSWTGLLPKRTAELLREEPREPQAPRLYAPGPPARDSPAAFPVASACRKRAKLVTALSVVALLGHTPCPAKSRSLSLSHRGRPEPRSSLGVPSLPAAPAHRTLQTAAGRRAAWLLPSRLGQASCLPRPRRSGPQTAPAAAPQCSLRTAAWNPRHPVQLLC